MIVIFLREISYISRMNIGKRLPSSLQPYSEYMTEELVPELRNSPKPGLWPFVHI